MFRIREVWEKEFGLKEYNVANEDGVYTVGVRPPGHFNTEQHNFDTYHNIISFANGAVIYVGSLDNYKSLDGMEVGWAILDETKDTREEAVKEVILGRLRQKGVFTSKGKPFNPLFIFTSPAKVPWISAWFNLDQHEAEIMATIFDPDKYFFKEEDGKRVTISSAYHNEINLPDGFLDRQMRNLPSHLHDMLIFGSPFSKSGGEFYKCFDRQVHVKDLEYLGAEPLHLTFDFNVAPYVTLCIWQIIDKTAKQINEICLSSPNNTSRKVCKEFARQYQNHASGVLVYGDPGGNAKDTRGEEGANDFKIIEDELNAYHPILRVPTMAPSVVMRGNFINTIFESNYGGIKIEIGSNCPNTIADYTYLKENSEGKKFKKKVKDRDSGATFEEFGHTSDANDYFLTEAFRGEYLDYQTPPDNDQVRTYGGVSQRKNKF